MVAEGSRTSMEKSATITSDITETRSSSLVTYRIDSRHAGAHFKVRHMMISWVQGEFSHLAGSVEFDPANPGGSRVEATIDPATVSTRDAQRDRHLRSADFLDVARFPLIAFQSTKVVALGTGGYEVEGELTIRGVTRRVTLHVHSLTPEIKDPDGFMRRGAAATARIARTDFELTWNAVLESGGFVVGDEVEIAIDVELVRKAEG